MKGLSFRAASHGVGIALLALSNQVLSQDLDSDTPTEIETVTVVGQATNSLITTEDLETYQANDLADVFRLVPSISVGGSVGLAQKIYVRGLEDTYVNVTVDGSPQTSTLFHHIGRVSIDPDLLQQVEVQAGAGEATAGAGAIGGAIRFKTKSASDLLADDRNIGGKIRFNEFSNDGRQVSGTIYGRIADDWGVLAYLNDTERDNMEDGDGNEILASGSEQKLGFLKLSGEFGENQSLSLSYEQRDESAELSQRPNWIVREDFALYESEATRDTIVLNYGLQAGSLINLETSAYVTDSSYAGGRFAWLAEIRSFGFDLRNTTSVGRHTLTYGVDYRDDQVDSGYSDPVPEEEDHREEGTVLGIYGQAHYQATEALLLSYGLRYDDYDFEQRVLLDNYYGSEIEEPSRVGSSDVSLNAGMEYKFTDELTFGLGYAEASRGKEIGDGFGIDGWLWMGIPAVNSDLEAETVENFETSLEYEVENFQAKVALFQSEISDVIFDSEGEAIYENIGDVETSGVEASLAYRIDNVEIYTGFSSVDSELDPATGLYSTDYGSIPLNGYNYVELGNSRGDTFNLGFNYRPTSDWTLGLNVSHVASLTIDTLHADVEQSIIAPADLWADEIYALEKPSYTVADVFAEWRSEYGVTINLAVTNLFNEQYRDHSTVADYSQSVTDELLIPGYANAAGPWEAGRDIRLSASYSF